jgi:IS30 family transposase
MIKRKKITANERDKIASWLNQRLSQRQIASNLKRSISSINEEIRRNSWKGNYEAIHAQSMSSKRKIQAGTVNHFIQLGFVVMF